MKSHRIQSLAYTAATSALLVSAAITGPAFAADEKPAGVDLDELIVTASKREERLQDVPLSVSAISGRSLAERGIEDLGDISKAIPGVNLLSNEPDRATVSIRGVTTSSLFPTVSTYLDDVALSSAASGFAGEAEPQLFDLERVEVLKGPQGTLYGASAMGGAIKYVSRRANPGAKSLDALAQASATKDGSLNFQTSVIGNTPVAGGDGALRLGAFYSHDGGYVDRVARAVGLSALSRTGRYVSRNTVVDKDVNKRETWAVQASGLYEPNEGLSIRPSVFYQSSDGGRPQFWTGQDGIEQSNVLPERTTEELLTPIVTVTGELGDIEITGVVGYVRRDRTESADYTSFVGALVPPFAPLDSASQADTRSESFSQELRLSGQLTERWHSVVGLYHQNGDVQLVQTVTTFGSGRTSGLPADQVFYADRNSSIDQWAAFGEVTYEISPTLKLILGGRLFTLKSSRASVADGLFNGGRVLESLSVRERGFTPKVELAYRPSEDNLLYALASEGFRPGGGNSIVPTAACSADLTALGLSAAPAAFKSDRLWNYEIGSKNTFNDGRVTANVSAYYIDWRDIQQRVDLAGCGFFFVGNPGGAVSKGVEAEFRAKLFDGLTLDANVSYNHARITASAPGVSARVGDPVIGAPEWGVNLGAEYRWTVGGKIDAWARADYHYTSGMALSFNRTLRSFIDFETEVVFPTSTVVRSPGYWQPGFDTLNLAVGASYDRWRGRIFVHNALNAQPLLSVAAGQAQNTAITLKPRTIGMELGVTF